METANRLCSKGIKRGGHIAGVSIAENQEVAFSFTEEK